MIGALQGKIEIEKNQLIDGDEYARLYTSTHEGGFVATTAVHSERFGFSMGGVRFVEDQTVLGQRLEVAHLAKGMTCKNAVACLPADGQKTVIVCKQGVPDEEVKRAVLRAHIRAASAEDPELVFGPDMNTPESVLNRISEDASDRIHVTGLSPTHGGLGIDSFGYTAAGLNYGVSAARDALGLELRRAVVQGSGAVGRHVLEHLDAARISVVGISNALGALLAEEGSAIPIRELTKVLDVEGDAGLASFAKSHSHVRFSSARNDIFSVEADLFVPAARTRVLDLEENLREAAVENPEVSSVQQWYQQAKPKLIVQGANHPLSRAAERWLHERGVINLPDFIVNCGGLIGCFFEWAYRDRLLSDPTALHEVDTIARRFIERTVGTTVRALLASGKEPRSYAESLASDLISRNHQRWVQDGRRENDLARVREYIEGTVNAG